MLEVKITSESKGSNPGGRCSLPYLGKQSMDAYIKYCNGSKLPSQHPFDATKQPFYEAITLALAEKLGLHVPRYFVLMNDNNQLSFNYENINTRVKKLDDNKPCYFVSRLVTLPLKEDLTKLEDIMKKEKVYRDLLMVGDVSGKKQNFALIEDPAPEHVLYIDLGCSFVDASSGKISQRNYIARLMRNVTGKAKGELRRDLKKVLRQAENFLGRYALITNHHLDSEKDILTLTEIAEDVPEIQIPTLNPRGKIKVSDVLTEEEIDEIVGLLKLNMAENVKNYRDSDVLVHLNSH